MRFEYLSQGLGDFAWSLPLCVSHRVFDLSILPRKRKGARI